MARGWTLVLAGSFSWAFAAEPPVKVVTGIPVDDVRLLDGPFLDAQGRDLDYMLSLDPDRLLSGMRAAAGLKPKGPLYGGWEKNGSGIVGHYLSACAWMSAATGDERIKRRVDYIVDEMAEYQKSRGDGGLYASQWEADDWYARLGRGELRLSNVLPWYVGHKTLAGLRDAWLTGGNTQARDVLIRYADWCATITSKLDEKQWRDMTAKEIGAPNEVFADLHAVTKEPRYLALAEKFTRRPMFDALERGERSAIHGHHANTEIPMFVGYQRTYEATGEERWHRAAVNFWDAVIQDQTFAFGGNSIWEAFIAPKDYEKKLTEPCGPETCNTYNLLKLTRQLQEDKPQGKYLDYIERALFNHILTSIGPAPEKGFAYYTPTRPGHYKRYSTPFDAFWCCVGSGMENHARYGSYLYAEQKDRLLVNLFIPSEVRWREKSVEIRQTTDFPNEGIIRFSIKVSNPTSFTLSIRCPGWADKTKLAMQLNDRSAVPNVGGDGFIDVRRTWNDGDVFKINLPPRLTAESTPGGKYVSFFHGPILLATAMGKEGLQPADFHADGSQPFIQLGREELAVEKVPSLDAGKSDVLSLVGKSPANEIRYPIRTTLGSKELVPFYKIGLERYSVYFPVSR
ncbi:glycoside hydrolase family 127 protein [Luteolibacter yonseiensis]|uniref:Glycoside hydrolase family 127 protein n=1 Tax=Luteolibacter yonseiensis TaxID=1144680 RepID=A0A934R853_9BACT|nr:beta-L-arabinofuranosidase domain-containing protein [Luteolibacter yonseiensis]MBK1817693.1 glycoside hydrolase family 127 protein [Luteolibacter yonseiensis]